MCLCVDSHVNPYLVMPRRTCYLKEFLQRPSGTPFHSLSLSVSLSLSLFLSLSPSLSRWLRLSSGGARRCRLSWAHFVKLNLSLFQEQLWGFEASLNAGLKKDHPVKMLKRFSTRAGWGE